MFPYLPPKDVVCVDRAGGGNPWPYIADFFKFVADNGSGKQSVTFQCKLCLPKRKTISANKKSLYNLKSHISCKHPHDVWQFETCLKNKFQEGRKRNSDSASLHEEASYKFKENPANAVNKSGYQEESNDDKNGGSTVGSPTSEYADIQIKEEDLEETSPQDEASPNIYITDGMFYERSQITGECEGPSRIPKGYDTHSPTTDSKHIYDHRVYSVPRDEYNLYGDHIANEIRNMDTRDRCVVKHLINNVIFDAQMGKYKDFNNFSNYCKHCL